MRTILISALTVILMAAYCLAADPPDNVLVCDVTAHQQVRPQVAADGDKVYVVWEDWSNYEPEVRIARSIDGGISFGESVRVGESTPQPQLRPDVAAHGHAVWVVWADRRSELNYDVYCARSTDGGRNFEREVLLAAGARNSQLDPRIARGPSGELVVVWADNRDTTEYDYGVVWNVYAALSIDNGASFAPAVRVDNAAYSYALWPDVAVGDDGTIHVLYRDYSGAILHAASLDGGASFGAAKAVSDGGGGHVQPRVAVDGDQVWAVWSDSREAAAGRDPTLVFSNYAPLDVYADISVDNGQNWGADFRVNPTQLMYQLRPDVDAQDGFAVVAFSDDREVGDFHIYVWRSDLDQEQRLDDDERRAEKTWPAVDVDQGRAYVVWQDDRGGDYDVYLAVIEEVEP
ncbi:MAG: hypothetical protein P9M14_08185 [Candidatus Alcyoniella australis]|nr:hypothetical protein [Candidatus Alcyoniella australis]